MRLVSDHQPAAYITPTAHPLVRLGHEARFIEGNFDVEKGPQEIPDLDPPRNLGLP